jgi:SM-20-related protein
LEEISSSFYRPFCLFLNRCFKLLKPMQSKTRSPQVQQVPDQIEVTLLLTGGQEYTLFVPTDDLLLRQLFEVMMDRDGKRARRLFQIPIDQGKAMLAFPCDRLVGLITNPPLIIQQPLLTAQPTAPESKSLLSKVVQFEQFLTPAEHAQLLRYVLEREPHFVSTSTSTGDVSHRRSVVLYDFPEFAQLITDRVRTMMPNVLAHLEIAPFEVGQIEAQLTAHNDGNYYKIHNDNGSPDTASRELTYVYFFTQAETFKTVEPRNNSIVFFLSRYMHEVLPISCPSKRFSNSRFTVNGWVRRN